jgi:hypothetical protein
MMAIVTADYKGFRRTAPKILFWELTAKHPGSGGNSLDNRKTQVNFSSPRARKAGPFAVALLGAGVAWAAPPVRRAGIPMRHFLESEKQRLAVFKQNSPYFSPSAKNNGIYNGREMSLKNYEKLHSTHYEVWLFLVSALDNLYYPKLI